MTKQNNSQSQNRSYTYNSYVGSSVPDKVGGSQTQTGDGGTSGSNTKDGRPLFPCLACNTDGVTDLHSTQHSMETCEVWNSISLKEKESQV